MHDPNHIEASEADYLYISTSQLPNAGNGLFSAIDIYKDEIIAVYLGEILDSETARLRAESKQDQYFINMLDGNIFDSMIIPCFAKYANDTKGTIGSEFKNNSKIGLSESNEICLLATRKIKAGEEIFCDYGKRYWLKK